jgi:hypothetical protein
MGITHLFITNCRGLFSFRFPYCASSQWRASMGCQARIWTWLSYAAPFLTTPLPTELAALYWITPHPDIATPNTTEQRHILLTTPHPTELCPPWLSSATAYWAIPHLNELRRALMSYTAPYWATSIPTELCRTHKTTSHPLGYVAPLKFAGSRQASLPLLNCTKCTVCVSIVAFSK